MECLGLPVPGESLIIAGALLASQGRMNIALLSVSAWLGAFLGNSVGYAIGWSGGRKLVLRYGRYIGITQPRLARVERFFDHYGGWVVVIGRFIALVRQTNGLVAGIARMPASHFLGYNALGAALWVALWGVGVYYLGHRLTSVMRPATGFAFYLVIAALAALVVGGLGVLVARRWLRQRDGRAG